MSCEMVKVNYRYVQSFIDRHGKERIYYRRKGQKRVALRGPIGSAEFWEDYRGASANSRSVRPAATNAPSRPMPRTWRWVCMLYFRSVDFKALDPTTQRARRRILELTWDEPSPNCPDAFYADCPIDRLSVRLVRTLRDRKREHAEAANSWIKAIRSVFSWAIEEDHTRTNPARDVPLIKTASHGFHTWTDDEIRRFEHRHPVGTKARLAFALMLYTGQRRSDIVQFGRQHVNNEWIKFTQHKNRNRSPLTLELPILRELQSIIDESPTGDMTYLVTEFEKPFTSNGFGNWFRRRCNEAGLPNCSAHGLRKAAARRLAEWGATTEQIKAWCGWRTAKEVDRYVRDANQRRLASSVVALFERGKCGT